MLHNQFVQDWEKGLDSDGEFVDYLMPQDFVLVHGGAAGVDTMATDWMIGWDRMPEIHKADWSKGRSAGIVRNHKMVALGSDICLAFIARCHKPNCSTEPHGSHGASNCAASARQAGIPTTIYKENW